MSQQSRLKHMHKKKGEKKARRRRAMAVDRHPRDSDRRMRHMSRRHLDVLQNTAFALVRSWREDPSVDDGVVHRALRAAMKGERPQEPNARAITEDLASIRQWRDDVAERVWHDALLTVDESVRRHSLCRPGEREYRRFVAPFVP